MKTSVGDIDIELWTKEAPKACRNFIKLCYDGYYNNTIFHRVVKGFIAQGGDPLGTGEGGESIYGRPFKVLRVKIQYLIFKKLLLIIYFHFLKNKSVFSYLSIFILRQIIFNNNIIKIIFIIFNLVTLFCIYHFFFLSRMNFTRGYDFVVEVWLQWRMQEKMIMDRNSFLHFLQRLNCKINTQFSEKSREKLYTTF